MEIAGALATDAGMFALWAPVSFNYITDNETWESALLEDEAIARHIVAGVSVPVNIGADGAFQFVARVGTTAAPSDLTEREAQYAFVTSEPYLFISTSHTMFSGIEHVQAAADAGLRIPLHTGRWSVTISMIDWGAEPGQKDDAGQPTPTALPDFTLLINPEPSTAAHHRTKVQTFDR